MTMSRELGSLSDKEKWQEVGKRWRLLSPSGREEYSTRAQGQGGRSSSLA